MKYTLHPSDIAIELKELFKKDQELFFIEFKKLPDDISGDVLLELPEKIKDKVYTLLSNDELVSVIEELETDDATDLIQDIEESDENRARDLLESLDEGEQEDIKWLKRYNEDEAGAFMQTELFEADLDESIEDARLRLKELKQSDELENIHQVFITNKSKSLIATISLEELFIQDFNKTFAQLIEDDNDLYIPISVTADEDIKDVVKVFEKYDLSAIAVVGYKDRLLGRITSDDIYDIIEETATEQIYNLAGVNEDVESEEQFIQIGQKRASWLFINLITAISASLVIGIFDETIKEYIALAILMPIVASMGGNAGTQTLTIMVRQLALGDVSLSNYKESLIREIFISLLNAIVFAFISGMVAYIWFDDHILGFVIAMAMIINLIAAGFFGAAIPLVLKKLNVDPAIGSTVILTTITDIVGFFSFLALAKWLLV